MFQMQRQWSHRQKFYGLGNIAIAAKHVVDVLSLEVEVDNVKTENTFLVVK